MTHYLTFDDVLHIHADRMKRLGREPSPLRDEEALRGAHLKPFAAENAVNYVTAYATMEVFLELNGYLIGEENQQPGPDLATYLRLFAGEHDFEYAPASFAAQLQRRVSER